MVRTGTEEELRLNIERVCLTPAYPSTAGEDGAHRHRGGAAAEH